MGAVTAFDTGPANMVIDAATQSLFAKPFDRGGKIAARGRVIEGVVAAALEHPFFAMKPPRSAGREEFGGAFAAGFLASCARSSSRPEDAVATATALTARSIAGAHAHFVMPAMKDAPVEYLLSGGGAKNATLTSMLAKLLTPLGCKLGTIDKFGMPAQAKEAVAFALLAYQTLHARAGNVPSATGASRAAILGQITYA
jgi:anhydro-N-acetylmuramic acid kinase